MSEESGWLISGETARCLSLFTGRVLTLEKSPLLGRTII